VGFFEVHGTVLFLQLSFWDCEKLESTHEISSTKKVKRTNSVVPTEDVDKEKIKHNCRYHLLLSFVQET